MKNTINFNDYLHNTLIKDEKRLNSFLKTTMDEYSKDGDEKALLLALKIIVKAQMGFVRLSQKTGLSRETLYKTLSVNGNPTLSTLTTILKALGYGVKLKKISA